MSSFYGGKQGRTYHIVARYDCVYLDVNKYPDKPSNPQKGDVYKEGDQVYLVLDDTTTPIETRLVTGMVNQFKKGGSYIEANYGEYVLIDTVLASGKSSRENGLLYRRGFDYLEEINSRPDESNSKYITEGDFDEKKYQADWIKWVMKPGGGAIYVGQIVGSEGKVPKVSLEDWADFEEQYGQDGYGGASTISMNSPGMYKSGSSYIYNDLVDAGYINILDEKNDIVEAYLSFDIPTPVFNITAQSVQPYGGASTQYNIEGDQPSVYNIEASSYVNSQGKVDWKYTKLINVEPTSTAHPFFHNFDISIPKGIHGQNIDEFKIETASSVSTFNSSIYPQIVQGDNYLTYTITNYDQSAAGSTTAHLGRWPYRVIDYIEASTVNRPVLNYAPETAYSLGDIINIASPIYAICTRAGQTGENSNIFNNAEVGMQIDQVLTDSTATPAKWSVISLTSTPAATSLRVDYKAGEDDYIPFKQVDHFFSDSETGDLYVVYSTDLSTPVFLTNIKQIKSISVDENIKNNQDIIAEYKNGNVETVGTSNQILDIQRFGDTIRVLYSDPRVRNQIPEGHAATLGANETWVDWRTGTTYTAADGLKWYNFGDLGSQFHVQGTLSFDDLKIPATPGSTTAVPWGLGDAETGTENRQGWIVSIPDVKVIEGEGQQPSSTVEVQRLFAYNYTEATPKDSNVGYHTIQANNGTTYSSNWYEIMSFSDALTPPEGHIVVSQDIDSPSPGSIYQTREQLVQKGVWLVVTGGTCNAS